MTEWWAYGDLFLYFIIKRNWKKDEGGGRERGHGGCGDYG